jgi:hypothetical protein
MRRRRHRPLPLAVLLCVVAVAVAAPNCFGQTVPAGADTWVSKLYPNRNYGADSGMRAASLGKQTLVRFAVPPLDGDVHRVVLRIYARAGAPHGLRVFSTSAAWDERAVNYKNAPRRGVLVAAVPGFSGRAWREIDVTSAVTAAGVESFLLAAPRARRDARFGSREAGRAPRLVITTDSLPPGPEPDAGTVITTTSSWECSGPLSAFGPLPIKVVSTIANPGNDNAINLRGCSGDGDPGTIDLILDVHGNGADVGTAYDAVRIGQDAHDLVVTGNVECGARHPDPSIHQDIVQALSGNRITFVDFTSGDPFTGRWTCWGAGGGWYVTWANAGIPTDLVCLRCILATYNQNLRIDSSLRSGARDSVFGYSRSYGIFIGPEAESPVNENNQVIEY